MLILTFLSSKILLLSQEIKVFGISCTVGTSTVTTSQIFHFTHQNWKIFVGHVSCSFHFIKKLYKRRHLNVKRAKLSALVKVHLLLVIPCDYLSKVTYFCVYSCLHSTAMFNWEFKLSKYKTDVLP